MSDDSWLDLPDTAVIGAGNKIKGEKRRGNAMKKTPLGKKRIWFSDGEFVWFRRKMSNPATLERHNKFIASGHYRHVDTQDDVEVYALQEGSPFKRHQANLAEISEATLRRVARMALARGDYGLFIDVVVEKATRLKARLHAAEADQQYQHWLEYIFRLNEMGGGPSQAAIDRGVQHARKLRGETVGKIIMLPSSRIQ